MNDLFKLNSIYKVNHLVEENKLSKIIVFYGKHPKDINTILMKDPNNELFIDNISRTNIFSKEEIENILSNKIQVIFSDQQIHFDDSIGSIKVKIFKEMKESVSLEEMYLFALKEELVNNIHIYQSLVQTNFSQEVISSLSKQKSAVLSKEKLEDFISKKLDKKISLSEKDFLEFIQDKSKDKNIFTKKQLEKLISRFTNNTVQIPKNEFYDFIQTIRQKSSKNTLTKAKLEQFTLNIIRDEYGQPVEFNIPDKEFYDFNDIVNLHLNDKKFWVAITLGQKKTLVEQDYPYVINPFDTNNFFQNVNRSFISTINSNILLDSGKIIGNNIYLCLAKDVLKNSLYPDNILKLYYPNLYSKNVHSLDELKNKEEDFKEENKKLWNENLIHQFQSVDLFYDIYKYRKTNLNYKITGIKYIKVIIKPEYNVKIPLDTIFKILHATTANPLIKFNPGSKQENIYRLFTDKVSTDGRKIPMLSKTSIFKLIKTIGKTKSISVYIENSNVQTFVLDFFENGEIIIHGEFPNVVEIVELEELIRDSVNPIIQEMKTYLLESGYNIKLFNNLLDNNIEVKNIHYQTQIEIAKEININNIKNCINSIFIVENTDIKKNIHMRYKRVSNFNKRNSQEAYIIEKQRENYSSEEIISGLIQNYSVSLEDARSLYNKILNETQVSKNAKKNISEIKINPGFNTTISLNKFTSTIIIDVENINDIYYLYTIPIYLDSLIRLTQIYHLPEDNNTTRVPIKTIHKLCSSKKKYNDNLELELEKKFIIQPEERVEEGVIENDLEEENKELEELNYSDEVDNEKTQKALDLFLNIISEEEEEEDEEEEDEEEEQEMFGGNSSSNNSSDSSSEKDLSSFNNSPDMNEEEKNLNEQEKENLNEVKNIDGMNINNPYYFQERIQQRDPALILTKPYANFNAYSRVCPSSTKRQPVILNQQEFDKINREHKGFLKEEDVIKYGSEKGKEFYYICPRYWCLKTNTIIEPSELKEVIDEKGNKILEHPTCGRVLPPGEKKIKPGYYIYEFYNPPKGKENTFKKYPGFQQDSHPQGFGLPCCFNNWNTPDRINSRNKYMKNEEKEDENEKEDTSSEIVANEPEDYIKGPDKFPLDQGRWGYLPVAVQKFLNEPNNTLSTCKSSHGETKTCLLRHGVEINEKQSFIACIADALFYAKKDPNGNLYKIPSIKQMKDIIISSITLDKFITYQNGNLVTNFYKLTEKKVDKSELEEKYSKSKLYSKLNLDKSIDLNYFTNVTNAFENFIKYLKNDEVDINFTYLWDIICKPNENLFNSGINLVILKITNNDISNNIELLCPTNHYSNEFFETRKPSLILINEGNLFEPIYSYRNDVKKKIIGKVFSEYDPTLSPTLRGVFKKIIKPYLQNMCMPLASLPNIYKAKKPLLLYNLIQILYKNKYIVLTQVVNYNSQVIGVIAESSAGEKKKGFIPCFPSSINETYSYTFMINNTLWNTYNNTIDFLSKVKSKSHDEIPCTPVFKVVEEEHIVGIITETNQFIQVTPPQPVNEISEFDNLRTIKNSNYITNAGSNSNENNLIQSDVIISTSNEVDKEREDYIKKIKLETNFFEIFRNTIRILLNEYKNIELREKIVNELTKPYVIYSEKLKTIIKLLHLLIGKKIEFIGDENYYKKLSEVTTCIVQEKEKCNKNVCALTQDEECALILPERNLITNKKNENMYYGKMADELIRYSRIQNFMFKPQSYLSFNSIGYQLRENEILMIQSLLTQEYFDNLTPALLNQFVEYNTFDQAEPIKSQVYENEIDLNNSGNENAELDCKTVILDKIKSPYWNKCFPNNFKEKEYSKTVYCTYHFIIDLIKLKTNLELSINEVKTILYEEYKKLIPLYKEKILDILIIEGKKILGDQVKSNTLSFSNFLFSDNYFLTNLDMWILVVKYQIPCFFISNKFLLETNYNKNIFLGYGERTDDFAFILVPGFRVETIPSYKIIQMPNEDLFISLDNIGTIDCRKSIQEALDSKFTIEDYLQQFVKLPKTNYQKKKPKANQVTKFIIEEETVQEEQDIIIKKPVKKKVLTEKITGKKVIGNNTSRKKKE